MKVRFSGVVATLFIYSSFFSAITYATTEENSIDGLSKEFLERAVKAAAAAALSSEQALTYDENSWHGRRHYLNQFSGDATTRKLYTEEGAEAGLDDAILIEDGGQCFVAFQATQADNVVDWFQNANIFQETLCNDGNECCTFRRGFANGWNTEWKDELISDVTACVARCDDDVPVCLIISGHSQGGGIATAASLQLADITPKYEVITYAAPPALTVEPESCSPQMNFHAHYRFTKALFKDYPEGEPVNENGDVLDYRGLVFDRVSFLGTDFIGIPTYSVGELIIISSEDTKNVAHVGYNTEIAFRPQDDYPNILGAAHEIYWWNTPHDTGYLSIMENILEEDSFPVGVNGFENNMHCGSGHDSVMCASKRCDRTNGEIHPTCKSKLINGELCNNDDDCISGRCPSTFPSRCKDKAGAGEPCANNDDCIDGYYCPWGLFRKCRAETRSLGVDAPITALESSATAKM